MNMQELYDQVRDRLSEYGPKDDQSLSAYSQEHLDSIKETVSTSRKAQTAIATGFIYWYDGFMTERYGFVNRDEWHSFQIGFSDGYTEGEEITADLSSEPHYYATGRTAGTAVRNGQDIIFSIDMPV